MDEIEIIYSNLIKFIKFRYNKEIEELSKTKLLSEYDSKGYVLVEFDNIKIIILNSSSKYYNLNSDTKKLLIDKIKNTNTKELIVLVDNMELRNDKSSTNIQNIKKFSENVSDKVWVQIRNKSTFMFDIPSQKIIPKHTKKTFEEYEKERKKSGDITYMSKYNTMQRIYEFDPPVTWIGGRVGDIIMVQRPSSSTGYSMIEKRVIM